MVGRGCRLRGGERSFLFWERAGEILDFEKMILSV